MWNRVDLKAKGKEKFKANYWPCVVVSAIITAVTTVASSESRKDSDLTLKEAFYQTGFTPATLLAILAGASLLAIILAIVIQMFIKNPLNVGGYHFFLLNSESNDTKIKELFAVFKSGNFLNIFLTMFLQSLFISIGFILFIVPGIILCYQYRMVPYILAEEPSLDSMEVLKKSKAMMAGHKWNAFLLDLSFLGWIILAVCTANILGVFYVYPYIRATNTELYKTLKSDFLN